ncbi:MAG: hypothetical protein NTV11_02315 [Rhodocyclales bacterium]|nr:hypothetical protein [Rhodocyclales bacterium]
MTSAMAMAIGMGVAFAQTRASAGQIQSADPVVATGPVAVDPHKKAAVRAPNAAVKKKISRSLPKGRINPQLKPNPKSEVQAKIQLRPKSRRSAPVPPPVVPKKQDAARMEECTHGIQTVMQPARLLRLSEECERDFPASPLGEQSRLVAAGARHALDIQRAIGLSGDFFEDPVGDAAYRDNLVNAVRGDKEAAYRIAVAYKSGGSGVAANPRRTEQWLQFAAELGNGKAAWELAEIYNYGGLVADAARFEKIALDLGYQPPVRLPTRGY